MVDIAEETRVALPAAESTARVITALPAVIAGTPLTGVVIGAVLFSSAVPTYLHAAVGIKTTFLRAIMGALAIYLDFINLLLLLLRLLGKRK